MSNSEPQTYIADSIEKQHDGRKLYIGESLVILKDDHLSRVAELQSALIETKETLAAMTRGCAYNADLNRPLRLEIDSLQSKLSEQSALITRQAEALKSYEESVKIWACFHSTKLTAAQYIEILDRIGKEAQETQAEISRILGVANE